MQKISSYLYPNRINVVADVALFPVRWNIVYQNRVKIYQGVDNVLTLDVKNSDQKRIDISDMDIKMSITDVLGKEFITVDVVPGLTTGLATITLSAEDLEILTPQFLNFTIYRENEDLTKTILYADTQFGAVGKMELLGSAVPVEYKPREITRFTAITDTDVNPYEKIWYSDAVEITKPNQLITEASETLVLDFYFNKSKAVATVQFTKDTVINASTVWIDVLAFGIFPEDTATTKTISYPLYNRDMRWMRVKLKQETYNGVGATVNISKVSVGMGGYEYQFVANKPGKGYTIGEVYTVSGLRLGGPSTSPNGSWALTVATVDGQGGVTSWTPLAEAPVSEDGEVSYKDTPVNVEARSIDKIVVRI
jgi:hypothetical protein